MCQTKFGCTFGLKKKKKKKLSWIDCSHSSRRRHLLYWEILSLSHNSAGGTATHQRYKGFVLKILLVRTLPPYLSLTGCPPPRCSASRACTAAEETYGSLRGGFPPLFICYGNLWAPGLSLPRTLRAKSHQCKSLSSEVTCTDLRELMPGPGGRDGASVCMSECHWIELTKQNRLTIINS